MRATSSGLMAEGLDQGSLGIGSDSLQEPSFRLQYTPQLAHV